MYNWYLKLEMTAESIGTNPEVRRGIKPEVEIELYKFVILYGNKGGTSYEKTASDKKRRLSKAV